MRCCCSGTIRNKCYVHTHTHTKYTESNSFRFHLLQGNETHFKASKSS